VTGGEAGGAPDGEIEAGGEAEEAAEGLACCEGETAARGPFPPPQATRRIATAASIVECFIAGNHQSQRHFAHGVTFQVPSCI
jgi:hypothetical protein